jgi:hypothetical protein
MHYIELSFIHLFCFCNGRKNYYRKHNSTEFVIDENIL